MPKAQIITSVLHYLIRSLHNDKSSVISKVAYTLKRRGIILFSSGAGIERRVVNITGGLCYDTTS